MVDKNGVKFYNVPYIKIGKKNKMKKKYLVFNVSKENYIIEIENVREVINIKNIEKIPNPKSHILGMINIRGETITIINSAVILNTSINDIFDKNNKIIIFNNNGEHAGLVVNSVSNVLEFTDSEIDSAPLFNTESTYVSGVIQRDNNLYIIVDLNKTKLNLKIA